MVKGIVGTTTKYCGEVRMFVETTGGKIEVKEKNSGCKRLWDFLTRAAAGQDTREYAPKYIDIRKGDGTSILYKRIPFTGVVFGEAVVRSTDSSSVLFNATLLYEHLKSKPSEGVALNLIMLDATGKPLAIVESASALSDVCNSIVPGVDGVIQWKLTFLNAE